MPIGSYLIAFVLGLIFSLAFSPFGLWPLFLMLIPLFIIIANTEKARHAYNIGFFFALAFFGAHILWLPKSLSAPTLFGLIAWMIYPPLIIAEGAIYGFMIYLTRKIAGKGRSVLWLLPLFWVILEWTRTQGPLAFPWGSIAYIWVNTPLAQLAEYGGVYGLSLVTLIMVSLLSVSFISADTTDRMFLRRRDKRGYLTAIMALLIFLAAYGYGFSRLAEKPTTPDKTALLVQGNTDPLGRARGESNDFEVYIQLSKKHLAGKGVDLVVWPEGAIIDGGIEGIQGESRRYEINDASNGSRLITGASVWEYFPDGYKNYNAVFGLKDAHIIGRYNKYYLVPFGEALVFSSVLMPLYKVIFSWFKLGAYERLPGKTIEPIAMGEIVAASYVCYESVFPQVAGNMVKKGANVLVNISNDAWFGKGGGAKQHFDMGKMRAIETRRYILRAGNDGITAIINPLGRTDNRIERFERNALGGKFALSNEITFYVKYGQLYIWVLLAAAALLATVILIRNSLRRRAVEMLY